MARKRKIGDESYNARRREYRAAQRYLKKANENVGAVADKNRALARIHLENALQTYDPTAPKQRISSQIVNLGAQLGIDVQGRRSEFIITLGKEATEAQKQRAIERQQETIKASFSALESELKEKRTEREAQALISNPAIGKRIMGGLVDIWGDKVQHGNTAQQNREIAQNAIFKHYGVSSWVEVLEKLEQSIGDKLYMITGNELEMYDVVKLELQKGTAASNTVIA